MVEALGRPTPRAAGKLPITCTGSRPDERNTSRGFADLQVRELKLTIRDCPVHQKGDSAWVSLPGKPQIDKDGNALRDAGGRLKYVAVLEFADAGVRNAFSA